MGSVKVKNINNSSKEPYKTPPKGYSSWIKYWEKNVGNTIDIPEKCPAIYEEDAPEKHDSTIKKDLVGGHVKKVSKDGSWYIVPICEACNNSNNNAEYYVPEEYLVPVNKENF